jgi:hypothetical protein
MAIQEPTKATVEQLLNLAKQADQLDMALDEAATRLRETPLIEYAPHFDVTSAVTIHELGERIILCLPELPSVGLVFQKDPAWYDPRFRTTNYCVQMRLRQGLWTPYFSFSLLINSGEYEQFLLGACLDRGINKLMIGKHESWRNITSHQLPILDPTAGELATLATHVEPAVLARSLDFMRWAIGGKPLFAVNPI